MQMIISVEGGEYTGKTTFIVPSLAKIFQKANWQVLASHEPGGSKKGELIRQHIFKIAKQDPKKNLEKITQLFYQARYHHINDTIKPFLIKNKDNNSIIILDRYIDSTRIYQGIESGYPLEKIRNLEKKYVNKLIPDLTIVLYFSYNNFKEIFTYRQKHYSLKIKKDENYWDDLPIEKHIKRQRLYLKLPKLSAKWHENRNFLIINTAKEPLYILKKIVNKVTNPIQNNQQKNNINKVFQSLINKGYWNDIISQYKEQQQYLNK